jgi:hypothetical protein
MLRIASLVGILCSTAAAQWITNPATGNQYMVLAPMTWISAQSAAHAVGAHLVVIDDAAENQWVATNLLLFSSYIGGRDAAIEGAWNTPAGWPLEYTNWAPNQPDNNLGAEDYLVMWTANPLYGVTAGMWNDGDGLSIKPAIIERPMPQAVPFGSGCPGSNGTPSLSESINSPAPTPGATVQITLDNLPPNLGIAYGIAGLVELSAPLAPLGLPGCVAYVDLQYAFVQSLLYIGPSRTWPLPIPNLPLIRGRSIYAQALVLDLGINAFGATTSNGLELRIGF